MQKPGEFSFEKLGGEGYLISELLRPSALNAPVRGPLEQKHVLVAVLLIDFHERWILKR